MKDTTKTYFADTYALIDLIKGSSSYTPYLTQRITTTTYNLIELYYQILKECGPKIANHYLRFYTYFLTPITFHSVRQGMQFKLQYKKEKLSYVDCVGYATALELDIPFLTGDGKFKDKPNVEFVR